MPLVSRLFRDNRQLQDCLIRDSAHVTLGTRGQHVALIQYAVLALNGGRIAGSEISGRLYGPTTAATVHAYKVRRKVINLAYQATADKIVGRMTIAALDAEMALLELAELAAPKLYR